MNILAFDTSAESCSVALRTATQCLEKINKEPKQQAERLLPMINALLHDAGIDRQALDGIAITHGPGAFTGVRIAISAAQGLAYGLNLPVVTVSTLQVLAQGAYRLSGARHVLSMLDARMNEVYWGAYRLNPDHLMVRCVDDRVSSPEAVALPDDFLKHWVGVGSGFVTYPETISGLSILPAAVPEAIDIITLSLPYFHAGQTLTAENVLPVYLRDRVARVL